MPGQDVKGARGIFLERVPFDPVAWEAIVAAHADAEVYHSAGWLEYLAASQGAEAVVAVVRADGRPVGYFVGAIVRRFGIRILAVRYEAGRHNAWASSSSRDLTGERPPRRSCPLHSAIWGASMSSSPTGTSPPAR
jgi:hypothetical protein